MLEATEETAAESPVKKPFVYELSWEKLRYMLTIDHNGRKFDVIASMKPYQNGNLIQLLAARETALVNSSSDADALDYKATGAAQANREFFDEHVIDIAVDGKPASANLVDKLDALYKIRTLAITLGYLGIREKEQAAKPADETAEIEDLLGDEIEKTLIFKMVDDAGEEREIEATFVVRFPTAEDRNRWDQCCKIQAMKQGGRRIRYNYTGIDHLSNGMIKRIKSGFTFKGESCSEVNRDDREGWLARLPFIFKFRVIDALFGLATEKNA